MSRNGYDASCLLPTIHNRDWAALKTTLMLAEAESVRATIRDWDQSLRFDEARASIAGEGRGKRTHKPDHSEEDRLRSSSLSAGATEVQLRPLYQRRYRACGIRFVRSVEADLLVVPLRNIAKLFSNCRTDIAWVSDVIPCNLWVIR
jgi:hypothetical protein